MRERAGALARKWKHVKKTGRARRQRGVPRLVPAALGIGLVVVTEVALAVALWRSNSPATVAEMPAPETTDQCRSTPQFTADPAVLTVASVQGAGAAYVPGALVLSTEAARKVLRSSLERLRPPTSTPPGTMRATSAQSHMIMRATSTLPLHHASPWSITHSPV
jgi:hypothetical protein